MNDSGKKILLGFKRRWQLLELLELLLHSLGPAILVYAFTYDLLFALGVCLAIVALFLILRRPCRLTLEQVSRYIDGQAEGMHHSTGLLLLPKEKLSNLARLRQHEVNEAVRGGIKEVRPKVTVKWAAVVFAVFALLAFLGYSSGWADSIRNGGERPDTQKLTFQPLDSASVKNDPPVVTSQKLTIRPPSYTGLPPAHQSKMPIRALKGSRVFWNIEFDAPVDSVFLESPEGSHPMEKSENGYIHSRMLDASGFYNFKFTDRDGASYQSDLYAMEVFRDEPPEVQIRNLKQFVSFTSEEKKIVDVKANLSDDYGLWEAYIVATVTKGEGESVKFREERLAFDTGLEKGSKSQNVSKRINLDKLEMEPGDELYFYVGVTDTQRPRPNISRSETYFAVIEDTLSDRFAVESAMGADLMPAYFRSQRQLIIDTEKLIADRDQMVQEKFKATSNELGADQKSLRLKYGKFMGDEADSGIRGGAITLDGDLGENSPEEDDPTAEYAHNHDADGEHQAEGHQHEETAGNDEEDSPLENYLHNHDNPEESTLFTQSIKSKLRQAMNEMWDAELQLRLHAPKKSLPYQNRALKLIQDIKNSARVYVHRIGFDAPPIKEASRLTGEIEAVSIPQKQENLEEPHAFPAMRKAVERLGALIEEDFDISRERVGTAAEADNEPDEVVLDEPDRLLFEEAGRELASLAVKEPGKHLQTLQALKWLSDRTESKKTQLEKVRAGLLNAIPPSKPDAGLRQVGVGKINDLLLKELNRED